MWRCDAAVVSEMNSIHWTQLDFWQADMDEYNTTPNQQNMGQKEDAGKRENENISA